MNRHPNLRGRYERSVLTPMQWGLLAVIGYVVVLGLQVDTLRHTSFSVQVFDREVARVEHRAQPMQPVRSFSSHTLLGAPDDWPDPPVPTAWSPAPKPESFVDEVQIRVRRR